MNPEPGELIIFFTDNSLLSDNVKNYLDSIGMGKNLAIISDLDELTRVMQSTKVIITLADQSFGRDTVRRAIEIQRVKNEELPLVIITEKNKQDEAAILVEDGAADYITTDNMKRLGSVIKREIRAFNEVMAGKKARREIRELMNIVQSAEDEIYILGGESLKIKFANRKALENLGYQMEELYGKDIRDLSDDIDSGWSFDIGGGVRKTFHARFNRKDGTKYPAETVFQTAETEGHVAVLAIVHDITEKETVKQRASILDAAIDASASAVTVVDKEFNIIYVNTAQEKMSGMAKEQLLGRDIRDEKIYAGSGREFFEALKGCMTGACWVGEYQKQATNGEEYIMLGSLSPVMEESGEINNIVLVEEDITERVRIKSQLLHAQKMETVGELTSGIAHDFTNMLTAIGGFASIMKRKMDKESRFYTYVEKISDLTVRAKSLTKNLLTFSRKQMNAERVVSVNSLVESVGEFLSMVIGSRIELKIELSDEDINIMGDPVQLEQVIINLATNARDAIEGAGELTIKTSKTMVSDQDAHGGFREYAVISVRDNGCGIPKEKLEKIFEPFFTTKTEGKGTGLGLYIVTDIITRHNGKIDCNSEIGCGTEFVIKLPATDVMPEEQSEEEEVDSSTENVTILLVEDEKVVRESLVHALDVYGYDIMEAVNGKEALELFKEKSGEIDILITDIVMPVMSGITAYKEMIKIKPELKAIFTTGYVGEAHRKEGFDEKEHVVMIKPLTIKDLVKKIELMIKE